MPTTFTLIRSQRRTLSLQITPAAAVIVKAPLRATEQQIHQFVSEHENWIKTHLAKLAKHTHRARAENEYLFLGKHVVLTPGNYVHIQVKDSALLFPKAVLFRKKKELTSWYQKQAKELITHQVTQFAREMQTSYKEISFSDTSSQWGRCTHDNRLQFSWRLVMTPLLVINYVVIHELAHTIEKNHTRAFWAIVRKYTPSYRQYIKWLKEHGERLQSEF